MSLLRKRRRRAPVHPEGVRWIGQDGTEHPCTVTYEGMREGQHHWLAISQDTIPGVHAVKNVVIDTMPPNTKVNIDIPMSFTLPHQPVGD